MADEHTPPNSGGSEIRQSTRQQRQLYLRNYGTLVNLALDGNRLLVEDGHNIVQGIAKHLSDYQGKLTDTAFLEWAADIIEPAVERLTQWYAMRKKCRKFVLAAIWKVLKDASENDTEELAKTVQEIETDLWVWAFLNIDELLIPGTAKVSTRLYERARWLALAWRKKQFVRKAVIQRRVSEGLWAFEDCETLSRQELAEKAAAEAEERAS